tara:strand:+ start:385 stop:1086 length:702 start_codon:yes stop_codon:yes gene_type:complete
MSKILIKAIRPHRQKVLTAQGEEKRLQQWANQLAAEQLRGAGQGASGEQFEQARDALMREAVMNPEKHGLKFMDERVPFEGQRLSEELSEADPEGEAAAIDSQFAPEEEDEEFFEANNTVRDNSDYHSKLFDEQGNLRSTLKPDEEEEAENTKTERQHVPMDADHPDYFKTSRQTAFRDAWSLLKQGPYDSEGRYLEHKDIALCPQAKAYLASGQRLDKDPNFCNSCDFCHGK